MADRGDTLAAVLNSPAAFEKWRTDPLGCFADAGITLPELDSQRKQALTERLASADPKALASASGCIGCKLAVSGIGAGLSVACMYAIGAMEAGTGGANTPAIPAELAATIDLVSAAIARAVGLDVAVVSAIVERVVTQWLASILASRAWLVLGYQIPFALMVFEIAEAVCEKAGACPG